MNPQQRHAEIHAALDGAVVDLKSTLTGRWSFSLTNGTTIRATAAVEPDWLVLEAGGGPRRGRQSAFALIGTNAALAGPGKLARDRSGAVRVLVDLPLDCADLAGGVRAGLADLVRARGARAEPERVGDGAEPPCGPFPIGADGLAELGWKATRRDDGRLDVRLPGRGRDHHATVESCGDGVRVACNVADVEDADPRSREALGALLLDASAALRLARGTARVCKGRLGVGFESRWHAVDPHAIDRALAALAVACTQWASEAEALLDPFLADEYLAARGASRTGRSQRRIEKCPAR